MTNGLTESTDTAVDFYRQVDGPIPIISQVQLDRNVPVDTSSTLENILSL
jgi:hypothetical protein